MSSKSRPRSLPHADADAGAYAPFEEWLRRRRNYTTVAVVAVALVVRGACFLELAASPCFWTHEWDQSDMNTFHRWGQAIADGDWWSKRVGPPLHAWHRAIAADFARAFPERWATLQAGVSPDDPDAAARRLWDQWCGSGRTYQEPVYPYLVGLTYWALGPAVGWVHAWQMLLGVASTLLIYLITRRHFGELAAIVAALLALSYGPLVFYEFTLLRTTLIVFFGLLLVLLLDRARERQSPSSWLAVGVMIGFALALKAHFVFLAIAAGVLVIVWNQGRWARCGRCAIALVAGAAVAFSPVVVRNVVAGAPLLAIASNGPLTFLVANNADADYRQWSTRDAGRILGETNNAFLPTVIATLKTHRGVASYLRLLGRKAFSTWYWYEEPNNTNFYYGQLHSAVLRRLPVSFGLIGPLVIVGLVLALRRFGRCAPLYVLVGANLAVLCLFLVFARFRVPLAAALLPFAGLTVARLVELAWTRQWRTLAGTAVVAVLLAVITLGPSTGDLPLVRLADVEIGHRVYYDVQLESALSKGDLPAAEQVLRESLRRQPPEVRALGPTRPARSVPTAQLALFYRQVYEHHAEILRRLGRSAEAEQQLERAAILASAAAPALRIDSQAAD